MIYDLLTREEAEFILGFIHTERWSPGVVLVRVVRLLDKSHVLISLHQHPEEDIAVCLIAPDRPGLRLEQVPLPTEGDIETLIADFTPLHVAVPLDHVLRRSLMAVPEDYALWAQGTATLQ